MTLKEKVLESLISLMVIKENQKQSELLAKRESQLIC